MLTIFEKIKDRWLTWKTGLDKSHRDFRDWNQQNIVPHAHDVTNYFQGFKYIIKVDYDKINTKFDPMWGMIESDEFNEYLWPNRPLGQHAACVIFRGHWNQWDNRFHLNDFGSDEVFVATNNEADAIMITLKFS